MSIEQVRLDLKLNVSFANTSRYRTRSRNDKWAQFFLCRFAYYSVQLVYDQLQYVGVLVTESDDICLVAKPNSTVDSLKYVCANRPGVLQLRNSTLGIHVAVCAR